VIGGALATGLGAAVSVPLDRPGVGWAVAAAAGAGCVVAARRRPRRLDPARLAWALITLLLLATGALRAAGWLFALCVLTAAGTGAVAAAGAHRVTSLRGLLAGAASWPAAALRSLPWVVRGGRRLGGAEVRAGLTVAVTALLVLLFGALFASADPAFDRLFRAATPALDGAAVARSAYLFVVGALALCGAAYLVARPPDLGGLERPGKRRLLAFEWGLPVAALDLLCAAFVWVQFTTLFGGDGHVLRPGGPDYAEHARGGFWQLLAVTVLTLAVLGAAARWARLDRRSDRLLLRALLGALAALALVVVASALYRMHVYEQAYGFTRLRLLVSVCELWLGVLFALVLAAGVRLRAGWLPRAAAGAAIAALLGLVWLDPDRFIAERNVERYAATGRIDVRYLADLSADAVPALDRLDDGLRACALGRLARELAAADDWRSANVARARARAILRARPAVLPPGASCAPDGPLARG
jgi:hypothetical protein